jgi:sporulation protein YlmC with PRC-barrel domain
MKNRIALAIAGVALVALSANAATYEMKPGEWRATKLTGLNVYNSNNDKIGDIKELIIGKNGATEAVVVGAGGFLGMGEHDVAVPFNQMKWSDQPRDHNSPAASNKEAYRGYPDHAELNMTKDQLKALPEVKHAR